MKLSGKHYYYTSNGDETLSNNLAIMGALALYLDFISNTTGEVLYQKAYNSLKDKEDIYNYNNNSNEYMINTKKLINKINTIIDELNKK